MLCVLFLALTIPMTLLGRLGTSESNDQERYHWPTILAMSEAWPTVSLEDYRTATGPAYHAALAAVVMVIGEAQWPIRIINALVSLPLVVLMYWLVRRRVQAWLAAIMVLPIVVSPYVLSSAIWITTDNVAHWLIVAALMAATTAGTARGMKRASIFSALAAGVRQIHLWVIAPCALAALMQPLSQSKPNWPLALLHAAFVALPAMIVVALLVWWWGGLTPPYVEARHAAIGNPFGFGFAISLVGAFGVFYLPLMQPRKQLATCAPWAMFALIALALALTVFTPTTLDKSEGRWGGAIWAVVDHMPTVADRSIVFPILAALGALFLLIACTRAAQLGRSFEAFIVLVALVCFTVAHAVQPWCAQRYFEPMILVFVMWLASLSVNPSETIPNNQAMRMPMAYWLAPAALTALQLVNTIYAVYWQTRPADIMS